MPYSQGREEEIILRKIAPLEGPRCVLDIGAFDGVTFSNSRALIERGWRGILIEPNPFAFQKLLELYGDNPKATLINAAMGEEKNLIKFHEGGIYSTTTPQEKFKNATKWREYWVMQLTMSTLMNQVNVQADVISIDVEGKSFELLKLIPIVSWAPHVIVVEHDARMVEITQWAADRGYGVCGLSPENIILLKGEA